MKNSLAAEKNIFRRICRIQGEKPKSNEILGYPDDNT